jgi:type VI secretion system secreted protein VgrG
VCKNFAVHARTTITFSGTVTTIYGGDVSVSPGTSITGSPQINDGVVGGDSADFAASVLVAYAEAMGVTDVTDIAIEIGGEIFTPGTYRSGSDINFAFGTTVTLDGDGKYLFIAVSTLVTAADTSFILTNGAKAENVLWALGTAATLGARSVVEGSILAGTAITFGTESKLHGCALAQSAVTFESGGSIGLNDT